MLRLLKTSAYFSTWHYACKNKRVQLQSHATFKFATSDVFFFFRNVPDSSGVLSYITEEVSKTLVCALVTTRLDMGNALLLYGENTNIISKLQRVQNIAARLITRSKKHDHITPVLMSLHWLPVRYRIQYTLLLLVCTFKNPRYILKNLSVCINHKGRYGKRTPWWFNNHV